MKLSRIHQGVRYAVPMSPLAVCATPGRLHGQMPPLNKRSVLIFSHFDVPAYKHCLLRATSSSSSFSSLPPASCKKKTGSVLRHFMALLMTVLAKAALFVTSARYPWQSLRRRPQRHYQLFSCRWFRKRVFKEISYSAIGRLPHYTN